MSATAGLIEKYRELAGREIHVGPWLQIDQQRIDDNYAQEQAQQAAWENQQQQQQTLFVDPGWYDQNTGQWYLGVPPQQAYLHYAPPPPTASPGAPGGVLRTCNTMCLSLLAW